MELKQELNHSFLYLVFSFLKLDVELTIPNVVNIVAEISNWQELAIFLGMDATDIDIISNDYEPREYRQRLVEKWFSREPERSWEKLQRALDEVTKRRGSQTSKYSIPSTPTSPMGISIFKYNMYVAKLK